MKEIKNQAQALVEEYNSRLTELGVKIELSKKYFEATVEKRDTYHPQAGAKLLNDALAALDEKKERKYKRERNKYHCLILSLRPTDPKALPRELCKEYAFLLRKVEREHIGIAPEKVVYEENKILASVEKRLQKILKKAEKSTPKKVAEDTVWDALRYCATPKYTYKRKIRGRDRFFWYVLFFLCFALSAILLRLILWAIGV